MYGFSPFINKFYSTVLDKCNPAELVEFVELFLFLLIVNSIFTSMVSGIFTSMVSSIIAFIVKNIREI